MTFDNLQTLIDLLNESPGVTEITIGADGGQQVTLKRAPLPGPSFGGHATGAAPYLETVHDGHDGGPSQENPEQQPGESSAQEALASIEANRVGVFHTAKPPVQIGDSVSNGQIVGYIESIKLMNEVRSSVEGRLVEQMLSDGTPVEYGQPIYTVRTAAA